MMEEMKNLEFTKVFKFRLETTEIKLNSPVGYLLHFIMLIDLVFGIRGQLSSFAFTPCFELIHAR